MNLPQTSSATNLASLEAMFLAGDCDPEDAVISPKPPILSGSAPFQEDANFLSEVLNVESNVINENDNPDDSISASKSIKRKFSQLRINKPSEINSVIHKGDTDSSDDDANYLDRKYSEYGQHIRDILDKEKSDKKENELDSAFMRNCNSKIDIVSKPANTKYELAIKKSVTTPDIKVDIYTDPVFGIRITKPLISSAALLEKMEGRLAITMNKVRNHTENINKDTSKDWVIAGVIVSKSPMKTSQKGSQYSIWLLSDLKDDLKTVSLFLFKGAHKDLWKTVQGMVIGILNPSILDRRDDSKDQAILSVDNAQRIMIFGQSKDLGVCKSRKKNGDPCTAFVNNYSCEYCIYHVKQAYQQLSKRSELQSTFAGRGLNDLRNKVLGKNEVFYGGQSFTAIPSKKNAKHVSKDRGRLAMLSGYSTLLVNSVRANVVSSIAEAQKTANKLTAARVEVSVTQREKDIERLRILKAHLPTKPEAVDVKMLPNDNRKFNIFNPTSEPPKLTCEKGKNMLIDLNTPIRKTSADFAKLKALKYIQKNGPIKKANPMNIKGTDLGKKKAMEQLNNLNESKKIKLDVKSDGKPILSERFKKIMEATSANVHLLDQHDEQERQKYFEKLEKKEAMEEKMLNTFKIACKAVRCLKCKYTSFSASLKCKEERHPLNVYDSFKRFFKCLDCGNRTVSLDIIPIHSCKNCQSSRWEKCAMLKEKKCANVGNSLSIRGDEEKFIGAGNTCGNLNLMVPDS